MVQSKRWYSLTRTGRVDRKHWVDSHVLFESWKFPMKSAIYHKVYLLLFLMGLEFELRASYLQSRCTTVWATPPVHFAHVILEMGVLWVIWPWTTILLSSASQLARIIGMSHQCLVYLLYFKSALLMVFLEHLNCKFTLKWKLSLFWYIQLTEKL
jgi:hypothetical protein